MVECPICKSKADCLHENLYDDRYAFFGTYGVFRCLKCDHSFLKNSTDIPNSGQIYTDYYPRASFDLEGFTPKSFPDGFWSWLDGDACSACKWVPAGVRILDIGCGFCETLAYHRARGCDVYGVEADENVRSVADKYQFDVQVGLFDPDCYEPESFDYVTMQQVIEHVDDPLVLLQGVAAVLMPGGHAVLSTPNARGWGARVFGRKWINWHAPYHRHFFSHTSMKTAAQSAGLEIEFVQTITSSKWLRYQWVHLLTFPAKGEPSAFWSPHGKRSLKVRVGQKLFDALHCTKLNHLLTRLFDSLGVGDNYLFLLKKP
jgi:2-polyprenyl-3-methyl-5-hydroxy-6-metoxy-1,4-benzoquinol methylase